MFYRLSDDQIPTLMGCISLITEKHLAEVERIVREHFGNPSSDHAYDRRAKAAVETAREQVAELIGARPGEIVFTGCATEANNLALLGAARAMKPGGRSALFFPSGSSLAKACEWCLPNGLSCGGFLVAVADKLGEPSWRPSWNTT